MMARRTSLLVFLFPIVVSGLVGLTLPVQAQTGPGGVGDATGSGTQPENVLWLRADQGISTSGGAVSTWADQSGNGNDATSSNSPVLVNGAFNGKPAVEFVASDEDVFSFSSGQLESLGTDDHTLIMVSRWTGSAENQFTLNFDNSTCGFGCFFGTIDLRSIGYNGRLGVEGTQGNLNLVAISGSEDDREVYSQSIATSNPHVVSSVFDNGATPRQDLVVNNQLQQATDHATPLRDSAEDVYLGRLSQNTQQLLGDDGSENGFLSGQVAEVVAYDGVLNAAQLRIVYNHLSEKYDIEIANDFYSYSSNSNDVAGIGQAAASVGEAPQGVHTAANSGELRLSTSASSLTGGEYVLFGHDGASAAFSQVERPNGDTLARKVSREWRVDLEDAASQTVTASFDTSDLPSLPSSYTDYAIFVDDDGDFSEGATFYDTDTVSGTRVEASGVSISEGDYVTIGVVKRKITFAESRKTDFENTGTQEPSLSVSLNYSNQSDLPIDYSVSPGEHGPTAGTDYETSQPGTFTFPAGQTSYDLNTATSPTPPFRILDDGALEDNTEFVDIAVDPSSEGAVTGGEVTTLEFGIVDDDLGRTASVSTSTSSVAEDGGTNVTITVTLSSEASGSDVTVGYELSGDATAGEDYENLGGTSVDVTTGTVTIPDGNSSVTFALKPLDDNLYETAEDVTITLVSAEGGATLENDGGNLPSETVTITDDESPPTVAFSAQSFSGTEGGTVNATATLSEVSGTDIAVQFTVSSGSAQASDYSQVTTSPVVIPAGQTQAPIVFDLSMGDGQETTESFAVDLSGTQSGSGVIGSPSSADVNILDADGAGEAGPGGVGDQESMAVWLSAEDVSVGSGNEITEWSDRSGNGNDATVSSGNGPTLQTGVSAFNGQPVARFTSSNNDYLDLQGISDLGAGPNTIFAVSATNVDGQQGLLTVANVDPLGGNVNVQRAVRYNTGPTVDALIGGTSASSSSVSSDGSPAILASGVDGGGAVDVGANRETPSSTTGSLAGSGTSGVLGAGIGLTDGVETRTNYLDGDVAEIVVFEQALNEAQRIIIANHFAAKYDVSLTTDDFYAGDEGPGYVQDVIGVGQSGNGDSHLRAAAEGVRTTVRSGLDNGEFFFVGAVSGASTDLNIQNTGTSSSAGVTARADQDRFVDLQGSFAVDIQFDLGAFGLQGPAGDPTNYKLLRRSGTSGDWTVVSATPSVSGEKITFSNVNLPSNYEGYLTVGTTNQVESPLDTRLTVVRGSPGAGGGDRGWRFYGPPKTGPVQMQEIGLRTPGGNRQSVSFEANMSYIWDSGADPDGEGDYGEWVPASADTPVPAGRGAILYVYDDQHFPVDPELIIDPQDSGNNGMYSYTGDTDVTVGDNTPSGDAPLRSNVTFHLLANPYEVTYDLESLNTLGVDADNDNTNDWSTTVQTWDANEVSGGGVPRGSYKILSADPAKPTSERLVSPGQAFWVERADTDGGGATELSFRSTGRRPSTLADFIGTSKSKTKAASNRRAGLIKFRLETTNRGGEVVSRDDAISLYFRSGAQTGWDGFDATKMTPRNEVYASLGFRGEGPDGESILKAQDSRPYALEDSLAVEVNLAVSELSGTATLSTRKWWSLPETWAVTLVDTKTGSTHEFGPRGEGPYTFTIDGSKRASGLGTATERSGDGDPPSPQAPRPLHETTGVASADKKSSEESSRFVLQIDPGEYTRTLDLNDLSAQVNNRTVVLKWAPSAETEAAGFSIEHQRLGLTDTTASPDPEAWTERGFVEYSDQESFQYRVEDLDYGRHAFRLRQGAKDGTTRQSEVIEAEVQMERDHVIGKPYPNPVQQQAQMDIAVREAQPVQILLYDILGRKVRTIYDDNLPEQQTHNLHIDVQRLASGPYFLRVDGSDFTETRRMTVLR